MITLYRYEGMIRRLAWGCYQKLPSYYLTLEEIEQEGREVFVKLSRRRLKPGGARFSTLLFKSLQNRYRDLLREAYTVKRSHDRTPDQVEECLDRSIPSQQYLLEVKEFMDYLKKIDPLIADFFLHGPTEDLEAFAFERHMKRMPEGEKEGTLISVPCIEEFFGFSLKKLLKNFNIGRLIRLTK